MHSPCGSLCYTFLESLAFYVPSAYSPLITEIPTRGTLQGMVMPPRVSPTQLIVIPIPSAKLSADVRAALTDR